MIYFTENDIDRLIEDDVPVGDMTSNLLLFEKQRGRITLLTRHDMVVCCTEEAERMYRKTGLEVTYIVPSGIVLKQGEKMLEAEGDARMLHLVWRSGLSMIEFASGIATRTRQLVEAVRAVTDDVPVAGTRKHPPYLKKIALKALLAGGGEPHRTGLSDTILIFREHLLFTGGYDKLHEVVASIKKKQKEWKIVVEAHTIEEAKKVAASGADVVQMDKLSPSDFTRCKTECRELNFGVTVIAAGGVNGANAAEYAEAGADVLVTSWMYFAPPADIQVLVEKA